MTQESGVGEGDDGLRQVTQHDGVSDAPDLAVGNGGFNHAAKLGISWICFAKKSFKNLFQNPTKHKPLILRDFN